MSVTVDTSVSRIVFENFPMPPSSNNQYVLIRNRSGKLRHAPSKSLSDFREQVKSYSLVNASPIRQARKQVQDWGYQQLKIQCIFTFSRARLISKTNGRFKKLDVSNRLKAIHDAIAELLGIDDCCFWEISAEKHTNPESEPEWAFVEVKPIYSRSVLP